jgi:pimeloyl-ACP methyl ester carboxylesterase
MTDIASTELRASPPSAAWLRILALVYDPFLWLGEIAGMRSRRSTLVGGARGRVVEIGAGTGLNIAHYPDGIAELVLIEPEPAMRRRLARRLQRHARGSSMRPRSAYRWPMRPWTPSSRRSFFAPSTTPNARSARSHACQDNLLQPWRRFAGGCRCNCPTVELMRACGFAVAADDVVWRGMPPIVGPLMVGRATR